MGVANCGATSSRSPTRAPSSRFRFAAGPRKLATLIVEAEGFEVALVIDGDVRLEAFGGIVTLDESSPQPHARWAVGFLPDGERLVPLLDPGRLLRALREARRDEA